MKSKLFIMLLAFVMSITATQAAVNLTASDGFGGSAFNTAASWDSGAAPIAGNDYVVNGYRMRTPPDGGVHTFAGDSLTITNSGAASALMGLSYKGTGSSGSITIDNLILNGGHINHINGSGDVCNLYGSIDIAGNSLIYAKQGAIHIYSDISGTATITNPGADTTAGVLTIHSAGNTFTGNIINNGRTTLASSPNMAVLNFVIGDNGVNNSFSGTGVTVFNGQFNFDLTSAGANPGYSWDVITATNVTYGTTFTVAGFTDMGDGTWEIDANSTTYQFDTSTGVLSVYTPELIEDPISYFIFDQEYDVLNGDMTLPGSNVNPGWDGESGVDIPGWTAIAPGTTNGGTGGGGTGDSADGDGWHSALQCTDPDVYNITELAMVEGVSYTFTAQFKPRWYCDQMVMSIVANDDPNIILASDVVTFDLTHAEDADPWTPSVVTYTATASDAGKYIGVLMNAEDPDGGWVRFDDVHLYTGYEEIHNVIDNSPEGFEIEPMTSMELSWTPTNDPNFFIDSNDDQVLYYYIGNGDGSEPDYGAYLSAGGVTMSSYSAYDAGVYSIPGGMTTDQYCLWRVDTILDGDVYTGRTILFSTRTADEAPIIADWDWWITWVGQTATIWATVDDSGEGDIDLTGFAWTVTVGGENVAVTDVSTDPLYPQAEVVATAAGDYEVQLVVTDTAGSLGAQSSAPASFTIRVAENACAAAVLNGVAYNVYDSDEDCDVDMVDFSAFAMEWLDDVSLTEAVAY